MSAQTLVQLIAILGLSVAALGQENPAAPERVRLAFAPPKGSSYVIEYTEDESWDQGANKAESHVLWTMRDSVKTVSKKGRVFLEGAFLSVNYRAESDAEGQHTSRAFTWTTEGGFTNAIGDAVETVGKKEIPVGLKLVLDPRGASDEGAC